MKQLTFEGHSDDTAGCYWSGGNVDHDDCASGSLRVFRVRHGGHRMVVNMIYGAGGMWVIGIGPVEDDEPLPPWDMAWSFERYSAVLQLYVPDDTEVALTKVFDTSNEMDGVSKISWTAVS